MIAATVTSMPRVMGLLYLKSPYLGFDFTGVPQRFEFAQVHAGHGGLVGVGHSFPAFGAGPIDERLLVGDEERLRVVREIRRHAAEFDVAVQAPAHRDEA